MDQPTYASLGDHIETLEVEFDPHLTSYSDLLEVFRSSHDPTRKPLLRQYSRALMPRGDAQFGVASRLLENLELRLGRTVQTLLIPDPQFHVAEDYHQKYYLQSHPTIYAEVLAVHPSFDHMVASTQAARINGYLGGFGSSRDLERDTGLLGLSERTMRALLEAATLPSRGCPLH